MNTLDFLAAKRDGRVHSGDDIRRFIRGVVAGEIPDYQISAWLMAVRIRNLDLRETVDLTLAMADSGLRIDQSDLPGHPTLDKHSTGGVGDKTSLIVIPILAAAGIPVLKVSGRGLGHSGGTIDKLESIPGFQAGLNIEAAKDQTRRIGAAIISQTRDLVPADAILYALRDVTATVESPALLASSIMCKKLATGADRILLDVKVGRGAFLKSFEEARGLAELMAEIGRLAGVPTAALLTDMDEPLGYAVGNALEVREAIDLLCYPDRACPRLLELCLELAATGLVDTGRSRDLEIARRRALGLLRSGKAAAKLAELLHAQGGPATLQEVQARLPVAPVTRALRADSAGVLVDIDPAAVAALTVEMGAGRLKKTDAIDPSVGIWFHRKCGSAVEEGDLLAELHLRETDESRAESLMQILRQAMTVAPGSMDVPKWPTVLDLVHAREP